MGSEVVRLTGARVVHRSREMRRRWAGRTVVPAIFAGAAVVVAGTATSRIWLAIAGLGLVGVCSGLCWWQVSRKRAAAPTPCTALFSSKAITLEGKDRVTTINRDEVEGAWASDDQVTLRLVTGRDVEISLGDAKVAEKALVASRLSPYESSMRLPIANDLGVGSFGQALLTFVVLACAAAFSATLGWSLSTPDTPAGTAIDGIGVILMFVPVISIVLYKWLIAVRRRHAIVGTDSVVIEGSPPEKAIPLGRIDAVSSDAKGVKLALSDGSEVLLPGAPGGEGLLARIDHALRCRGRARDENHDLELLARGDLSAEQWMQKLRELPIDRGEQYRERFVGREALGVVVGDAASPPGQRVAAAVVLSADKSQRARILTAAASCADEDLRAALEAAAEGELEEESLLRAEARFDKS